MLSVNCNDFQHSSIDFDVTSFSIDSNSPVVDQYIHLTFDSSVPDTNKQFGSGDFKLRNIIGLRFKSMVDMIFISDILYYGCCSYRSDVFGISDQR